MSRGLCQKFNNLPEKQQSSSIITPSNEMQSHNICNNANKSNGPSSSSTQTYDQLMERSNVELNIFITHELCQNPIKMDYNPNKINSISRRSENSKVDRSRNNDASRISRFKRKRGFQLSKIKCEYFQMANDELEREINEMTLRIREKENLLAANKMNSIDRIH